MPTARKRRAAKPAKRESIGDYLIRRLQDYGIRHVFGIPGDYVLGFYDRLQKSPIQVVGTAQEEGAGFAADAYARINGIGALCVTYCVGGFSALNPIAGAWAEKSPVVVLSGSPGLRERVNDPWLHHKVRGFSTQKEIFEKVTADAVVLDDPDTALRRIDEALARCWQQKRPVYIELPRDQLDVQPRWPHTQGGAETTSDAGALAEAVAEAVERLDAAKDPVILADVEVHRYGLALELTRLTEGSGIPFATTILGKSVLGELHPNWLGVYAGALGQPEVGKAVESADCLLMLGTFPSDVNLGIFTANLDPLRAIEATAEKIRIGRHRYDGVLFPDFLRALANARLRKRAGARRRAKPKPPVDAVAGRRIGCGRLFELIDQRLEDDMAVVCDVGLALFGAIDLVIHRNTEFVAPAYYTSMGFGIPAAVGVAMANPKLRPVVLVGDGAFQMTGNELSTIAKQGLAPIIILLDNHGYTTERLIMDGPYNDLQPWRYERMPDVIGAGWGVRVSTEDGFAAAWTRALGETKQFSLIVVDLEKLDHCPALKRVADGMAATLRP